MNDSSGLRLEPTGLLTQGVPFALAFVFGIVVLSAVSALAVESPI